MLMSTCIPTMRPCFLRTGVNIVSAHWVLRSASQGSLQRVVAISLDASRRLSANDVAPQGAASAALDAEPRSAAGGDAISGALMDRAAREALLAELTRDQAGPRTSAPLHQPCLCCMSTTLLLK